MPTRQQLREAEKAKEAAEERYKEAAVRCRAEKKFYFLDLPKKLRGRIYQLLFGTHAFNVCSFTKDRELRSSDPWPEAARAQILCTNETIFKEARPLLFHFTRWHFRSGSALQYFTWNDVDPNSLACVRSVTLYSINAVEEFKNVSHHLSNLRLLMIDCGASLRRHLPLNTNHHKVFASRVKNMATFVIDIAPHLQNCISRRCGVYFVVRLAVESRDGTKVEEMVAVNVDTDEVVRNYRAAMPKIELETMIMPSAGDSDVEKAENY